METNESFIHRIYAAFNARDLDTLLAAMHPEIVWPNGMEGGYLHGQTAVRDYWTRQWAQIDPRVEPQHIAAEPDGSLRVTVHQVVRDLTGTILVDQQITHVYMVEGGLIHRMEIL
ncbi:MAG TPA: nuclear transport factor 2 family protein [Roseiflexaceae bacterium]|nr:nuclear transport factor 2 family protein [Roseiflexaceae bacterium]